MTNEIIDKYLDQQGVASGEWALVDDDIAGLYIDADKGDVCFLLDVKNGRIIANSRKSLRDWIMVAWESEVHKNVFELENVYRLASENIEASLSKPWETVRTELERMEG